MDNGEGTAQHISDSGCAGDDAAPPRSRPLGSPEATMEESKGTEEKHQDQDGGLPDSAIHRNSSDILPEISSARVFFGSLFRGSLGTGGLMERFRNSLSITPKHSDVETSEHDAPSHVLEPICRLSLDEVLEYARPGTLPQLLMLPQARIPCYVPPSTTCNEFLERRCLSPDAFAAW